MNSNSHKAKKVGYIVEHDSGLMGLGPSIANTKGVETLWIGVPSLFPTYSRARSAIKTTIRERRKWLATLPNRMRPIDDDSFVQKHRFHILLVVAA